MGNYSNTTLDRDRAFGIDSLNELLEQGKTILNEAASISEKIESSVTAISGIYSEIDPAYKVITLGLSISLLSGTLNKACYHDTIDSMNKLLNILMNDIPAHDFDLAWEMGKLSLAYAALKVRISDIKSLLETGDIDLSYEEFKNRIEEIRSGWNDTTETLEELLVEIEYEMLGVTVSAAYYSFDPVNLSTGNFVCDHEDMKVNGEIPLSFHRYYNSKARGKGSLGRCFVHNYDSHLEENAEKGKITVTMADGQKKTFRMTENGTYISLHSATETLTKEGEYYALTELTGGKRLYNGAGQMTRHENSNGRGITFSYDENGKLEKAVTDNGTSLTYSYNEAGQLILVTDHTGRSVELTYEKGKLATVKNPLGNTYAYKYGKNGRLEETVNPRGYTSVKNTYDDKRRITRQEFPDGGHMEYAYDDSKRQVILTERNGNKITYVHDSKYRNTDILYEDGTKEHFAYNGKNQRVLYVDRNGNTARMAYDNRGNLTQVINALGEKTNLTYNADNQLSVIKLNGKEKLRNSYDKKGNLIAFVGADGNGNSITYDGQGRPVRIENADKSITEITYDAVGNITNIQDAGGMDITYRYDNLNRVICTVDGNGNTTSYEYDNADKISMVTNPLGNCRHYSYNESRKVTKVVDYDGYSVEAVYNEIGKISRITDKEGNVTEFSYDSMWNTGRVINADGGTIEYKYDGNNRLCEEILPEGGSIRYTYDGNGNRTGVTDAEGNHTAYDYDVLNRIVKITDAEGAETCYDYDAEGNLTCITDAMGNRTAYTYDEMNRCTSKTDALGNTTSYEYDIMGNVESIRYPNGSVEKRVYKNGRLSEIRKADGSSMKYYYDGNGNCICMENGAGDKLTVTYDALNRRKNVTNPAGGKLCYEYDAMGNVTEMTDENGGRTCYTYTPNGNLASVTDALGNKTRYTYDAMGHLIKVERIGEVHDSTLSDSETEIQTTTYKWNRQGLVTGITDPLGLEETFAYDKNGRMTDKWDRDGYHTAYTYDNRGLITDILYGDGTSVAYSYDALRRLEEVHDSTGITKIVTDALGRIISVTDQTGNTVGYEWGSMNEKLRLVYPDGKEAAYNYNDKGQLTSLSTGSGTITYSYDPLGHLKEKLFPNGSMMEYSYNGLGMLEKIRHAGNGFEEEYSYQYDMAGNKTEARRQRQGADTDSGVFGYGYDALNRLTEVSRNGQLLRRYVYDAFGNRTVKEDYSGQEPSRTTYRYNAGNQMISLTDGDEEHTYTYDRRGNLTAVSRGEELLKAFTFNAANLMTSALRIKDGVEKRAEYSYDAFGNRIGQNIYGMKADNGISVADRKKPQNPERQIRYTIDLTRQYYNLLMTEDCTEQKEQTFYWDGNVASMEEAGHGSYYMQDDLGSPMLITDDEGEIRESYGYDEFGQSLYNYPEGQLQPFGYTGYQMEAAVGLYYAQARRYDAGTGRFVSEDKVKGNAYIPITINAYLYCRDQPLKYIDPSGNDCYYFYSPDFEYDVRKNKKQLAKYFGLSESEVHVVEVTDNQSFTAAWNAMGIENGNIVEIDAVLIDTHGDPESLGYGTGANTLGGSEIQALKDKGMKVLILNGCNAGHTDYIGTSPASEFSKKVNGAPVLASDGTVSALTEGLDNIGNRKYKSKADVYFEENLPDGTNRENDGFILYQYADGNVSVSEGQGYEMTITEMLTKVENYVCDTD